LLSLSSIKTSVFVSIWHRGVQNKH